MSKRPGLKEHDVELWRPSFAGLELTHTRTTRAAQPKHFHDAYQIGVIRQGGGTFYYRGGRHTLFAGTVAVVQAGEAHSCFTNFADGWSFSILYIDADFFNEVISAERRDAAFFPSLAVHHTGLARTALALFEIFARTGDPLEQESHLLEFLSGLLEHGSVSQLRKPSGREPEAVGIVKTYLHDHLGESVTLSDLAAVAGLSKFYLWRSFTHSVGMTPQVFQTSLRIIEAKTLLRRGQPLAQIALAAGFVDQAHFTTTFKKVTGLTPGQYQRHVCPVAGRGEGRFHSASYSR